MPFQKGHKKTGGKVKGQKGIKATLAELLRGHKFDPLQEVIKHLKSDKLSPKDKTYVSLELIQFVHPKLKAIEHSGNAPDVEVKFVTVWQDQLELPNGRDPASAPDAAAKKDI